MGDVPTGLQFVETPAPTKFNVLLYGPAKNGKSTAAASAEGPVMWVNFQGEGALGYARQHAAKRGTKIHEVRVSKEQDPREVLREVVKHVRSGADPRIRTVVIDTVANLRERLVKRMVQKGSRNSLNQYGEVAEVLLDIILTLRDEPVNVVLICHEDIKQGEGDEPRIVMPLVGGKTTNDVLAEVDIIAYCSVIPAPEDDERDVMYVAQLVEGRGRRAGDRSGALGSWRELDLTEWWGVYRDALTPDTSDLPWTDDPATGAGEGEGAPAANKPATEAPSAGNGDREAGVSAEPATDAAPSEPTAIAAPDPTAQPGTGSDDLAAGSVPIDDALAASERLAADPTALNSLDMACLLVEEDWRVLDLLVAGHTAASAANELQSTAYVVREHVNAIKKTLGQSSVGPIVKLAKSMRVIEPDDETAGA